MSPPKAKRSPIKGPHKKFQKYLKIQEDPKRSEEIRKYLTFPKRKKKIQKEQQRSGKGAKNIKNKLLKQLLKQLQKSAKKVQKKV